MAELGTATRDAFIDTALGKLRVQVTGRGPALLCWPSLLMTGSLWDAQVACFGGDHLVIAIDPPGHGASTPLTRGFTMEECAQCAATVLDALGVRECVVLGNSWGGMMGGVFSALFPERTRAAVLMNCTASVASARQKLEYTTLIAELRTQAKIPDAMIEGSVKAFAGRTSQHTKPEVIAAIRGAVSRADARSVAWAIESVVPQRRDQHALLGTIHRPVLVIAGDEDRTFPVAETKAMSDAIPGSRFEILPNVGHLAALEAPELVNASLADFLRTLPK